MTRNRFIQILRFLCFDKQTERPKSLHANKFALIFEPWNRFKNNSRACYKHQNITVNIQLFPTKARCINMPNKPHKFGRKFWLVVDVKSKYILNGFPYLVKDDTRCLYSLGQFVTLKLAKPYLHR